MFAPLVPSQTRCPHDIGHIPSLTAGWGREPSVAKAGPALVVLWPEPVQNPAEVLGCVALRRATAVTFDRAPRGRPRKRQHVIVEITGFILGHSRGREKECGKSSKQSGHFDLFYLVTFHYIHPKFPDNENPAPAVSPFKGAGKLCRFDMEKTMAENKPIMAKATAVWLIDNTTLSFKQVADFCGLHELEVQGIADGDVATGVKGFDPIANNQLTQEELTKAEENPLHSLKLKFYAAAVGEEKRRGPRYTPLSKRQDRPASILWLVKFHPELSDGQVSKLVGTTKPTIQAIRERTHWNIANIQPIDPVALGLCKQSELDRAVQKANAKKAKEGGVMSDDERRKLVSTEQSLGMEAEPKIPTAISGLETFTLGDAPEPDEDTSVPDADSFFNLPEGVDEDEQP